MKYTNQLILTIIFSLGLSLNASASTINSFSDWGIASTGVTTSATGIYSQTEDQTGNYLVPGYGGQAYDAEGIYATWDSNYLYVGVMTGRAQNASGWSAGDIAFDFGSDKSFEYGLVTSASNGSYASVAGIGTPGQLFSVSEWNLGLWDANDVYIGTSHNPADPDHPVSVKAGTLVDTDTDFSYSSLGSAYGAGGTSYFISTKLDLNNFGGVSFLDDGLSLHWAATCNNDWIQLDIPAQSVPEPSTLALLSLGLLGIAAAGRKRINKI
jgi:hypothetical protein